VNLVMHSSHFFHFREYGRGLAPIHLAAEQGHQSCIKCLVAMNVDVNVLDE
jgi:hypothetical protein